jgi:transcriptional regulator with XRE-family HTH domain
VDRRQRADLTRNRSGCAFETSWIYRFLRSTAENYRSVRHNVCIMSWENLGVAVRDRRTALGMTQSDVPGRGGPSVETLRAIENNRAGRLSPRMRRALERVLEWEPGSIDAILAGDAATPVEVKLADATAVDRFALARQVVSLKAAFAKHLDGMATDARHALIAEVTRSAREAEESIVTVMPWLDDTERGQAIELLVALREPIGSA